MANISLGRVTLLLLLGRMAGYVLGLLNSVILARTLGVDRLGAYAYAMGLAGMFGLLPNLGISTIITRTIARNPEGGAGLLAAAIRAQALLAGGVIVLIVAFAAILPGQPVPLWFVGLAAGQLAIGTLSWPYLAVLAGRARYDRIAVSELVAGLAGTLTFAAAAALHGGVPTFLWANLLGSGLSAVASRWMAVPLLPRKEPNQEERLPMHALFCEAAPFGATAAAQSLYTRLDIVMLGQMAPTAALGLYSAAYKPINMIVNLGGTVAGPLFPLLAREREGEAPVALVRAMRALAVTAPAFALAFSGLAGPVLHVLFGAEYVAAAPILIVLAWSAVANWLYGPLGVALQAQGHERWWLASLLVALAVNGAGNLWAIPRWGALGAAGATLASEVVLAVLGAALVWSKLDLLVPPRPVLVRVFAAAAGAVGLLSLSGLGPIPATLGAIGVYTGLLVRFGAVSRDDASLLLGWIRQAVPHWSRR